MRLRKITMKNFLAYEYEEVEVAEEGLMVFVGENGVGKTSIASALRFCLGSNQKDQRYRTWGDFIHNRRGARRGWVELVFEGDGERVALRREVRRGLPPRFYVDGRRATAEEVRGIVQGRIGVDPDNPLVFIPQDKIDAVVTERKPEVLRDFVEELIGLAESRRIIGLREGEVRELVAAEERLKADLKTIQERKAALTPELERLEKKRRVEERLRVLEGEALWSMVEEAEARLKSLLKREAEASASVEDAYRRFKEEAGRVEKVKGRVEEAKRRINELEGKMRRVEEEVAELKLQLKNVMGERRSAVETLEKGERRLEEVRRRVEDLRKKMGGVKGEEERLEAEVEELTARSSELLELIKKCSQGKREFRWWEEEWMRTREALARAEEALREVEGEERRVGEGLERIRVEIALCSERIARLAEKLEGYREEELKGRREELEVERKTLMGEELEVAREVEMVDAAIRELEGKVRDVGARIPEQVRRLEEEVRARGMTVDGPLLKVIDVPEEYAEAVEAVFGRNLLAFVAFSKPDFQVLKELRRRHDAWCTIYMPRQGEEEERMSIEGEGVIGWLDEVVRFPSRVKNVVRDIGGRVLLVRDYRTALMLSERHRDVKFVTLKGEVIESRRNVVRSPYRKPLNLLGVKRIEEELAAARRRKEELEGRLRGIRERLGEVEREVKRVDEKLRILPEWRRMLEEKVSLEEEERRIRGEADRLAVRAGEARREVEEWREKLKEVEARKPESYAKLEEEERRAQDELGEVNARLRALERKLRRVRGEREGIAVRLREAELEEEALARNLEVLRDAIRGSDEKARVITERIEELSEERRMLDEERRRLKEEREGLLRELGRLDEKVRRMERELGDRRGELARLREEAEVVRKEVERWRGEAVSRGIKRPEVIRPLPEIERERAFLEEELSKLADVGEDVLEEFSELERRMAEVSAKLEEVRGEVQEVVRVLEEKKREHLAMLVEGVGRVEEVVNGLLEKVNMRCRIRVVGGYDDAGVDAEISVRGGPMVSLWAISGGERSIFAIALIAALQRDSRVPLAVFDEPTKHLDFARSDLAGRILREAARGRQVLAFVPDIYVEFARHADRLYGVAIDGSRGGSIIVPVSINWPAEGGA
ncbi:MAG: AAA family ATPase [Candidatus Freyarchaeota archaeon]